jgi:hypothetical protein
MPNGNVRQPVMWQAGSACPGCAAPDSAATALGKTTQNVVPRTHALDDNLAATLLDDATSR